MRGRKGGRQGSFSRDTTVSLFIFISSHFFLSRPNRPHVTSRPPVCYRKYSSYFQVSLRCQVSACDTAIRCLPVTTARHMICWVAAESRSVVPAPICLQRQDEHLRHRREKVQCSAPTGSPLARGRLAQPAVTPHHAAASVSPPSSSEIAPAPTTNPGVHVASGSPGNRAWGFSVLISWPILPRSQKPSQS